MEFITIVSPRAKAKHVAKPKPAMLQKKRTTPGDLRDWLYRSLAAPMERLLARRSHATYAYSIGVLGERERATERDRESLAHKNKNKSFEKKENRRSRRGVKTLDASCFSSRVIQLSIFLLAGH